ncbi:MAG: hypothetical protein JG780_1854 [Thermosipho sp. (in: Bacteria)]|jgi:predicted small secreted protein|nr:hypothetical protein [Thermosipho sp. (in: thermotogales)]
MKKLFLITTAILIIVFTLFGCVNTFSPENIPMQVT